jgi:hypothetical protein
MELEMKNIFALISVICLMLILALGISVAVKTPRTDISPPATDMQVNVLPAKLYLQIDREEYKAMRDAILSNNKEKYKVIQNIIQSKANNLL